MIYNFNTFLAQEYGVDEAIALSMLVSLDKNRGNLYFPLDFVTKEGVTWVGFDEADFEQLLPFWSAEKCFAVLDSLSDKCVINCMEGRKKFYSFSETFKVWMDENSKTRVSEGFFSRLLNR